MVLSPAEKQQRYRERLKAEKEAKERNAKERINALFPPNFFQFLVEHGAYDPFYATFDIMGMPTPEFLDDADPKSWSGDVGEDDDGMNPYKGHKGSLGRAEVMVEQLIDAAVNLADIVNDFKRDQIAARLTEIEQADLPDPAARKAAMAEVVRLNKLLDQLAKPVRRNFPQWELKDD